MAYIPQQPLDEEEQPQQTGAGGSTIIGGGAPQTPAMGGTQPTTPRGSGSWTNLQRYLDVNRPQAAQMAGQIGQRFGEERQRIRGGIEQEKGAYLGGLVPAEQKAQQEQAFIGGLLPKDYSQVDYGALQYRPDQTYADRIAELEAKKTQFPWNTELYQGFIDDLKYKGSIRDIQVPTEGQMGQFGQGELFMPERATTPYQTAYQPAIQALQQRLQQTTTEPGRMAELRALEGKQTTKGESLLNQLLMQGSDEAKQMWQQQRALAQAPEGAQAGLETAQSEALAKQQALESLRAENLAQVPELQALSQGIQTGLVDPMAQQWENIMGTGRYGVGQDLYSTWNNLKNEYMAQGMSEKQAGTEASQNMPSVQDFMGSRARYTPILGMGVPGYDLGAGYEPGTTGTGAFNYFQDVARDLYEQDPTSPEIARVEALQNLLSGYSPEMQGTA